MGFLPLQETHCFFCIYTHFYGGCGMEQSPAPAGPCAIGIPVRNLFSLMEKGDAFINDALHNPHLISRELIQLFRQQQPVLVYNVAR